VDKNQTYYIKWFNNGGAYTWNLSESDAAPGEFCITALPAKQDTNISEHQNSNPLWFYYTPTRDCEINVSTCGLTTQQLSLYITTGCGTFDEVPRKITDCGDFQYTYSFQGIKGQKLYLLWSGYTITQPYKWVLTEANAEPGELCSSALTAVSDTNISDHTANYERWYVYTAKVNGTMRISNCGLTVYNTRLDVFTECGSTTPVATGLSSCFQQSEVNIPCKYGHKYYIRWQCADNSSFPWVIQETSDGTEVATIETPVFSVYPNPATQKIFISWKGQQPGAATLEMYNMQGQRVCTQKLFSQLSLVDIASLPSGIYMVVLKHDAGTYRTKVVVK